MRTVQIHEFGDESVLKLEHLHDPAPGEHEVLIDVEAAGVNFGDLLVRQGLYFGRDALPARPGWEVVGRVVEPGDSRFSLGDRVGVVLASGGYSEMVVAPADDVVLIPDDISTHVALAMLIQGVTAWQVLEWPAVGPAWRSVLLSGGGSGVTHMAVQLARARGMRAFVLCTDEEKAEIVARLGGDPLLVGLGGPSEALRTLSAVDLVVDMVGGPVLEGMLGCLRPGGHAVVYGAASGISTRVGTGSLLRHGWNLRGFWLGHLPQPAVRTTLQDLFDMHRHGAIFPTLGPQMRLEDAATAHRLVADRRGVGKVILRCG